VSDAQRQSLRRKLKVGEKEFMVLYAPTWRDYLRTAGGSWSSVNYMNDADSLPDGVKVFYRGHTNTQSADVDPSFHNVTSYPDITELCIAADVLVTDYSSTMFDFAVTGKPMIAFVPDLERYRAERGFYFDFEAEFPGPIVTTTEELAAALSDVSTWVEFYAPKYQAWQQKYTSMDDGTAAVRAADWLLDPQRLTK
jgi:CDP-glycerol glycerophosphotransferase